MMEDLNVENESDDSDKSEEEHKIKFMILGKDEGNVVKIRMTIDNEDGNRYWKEAVDKLKLHIHRKRKQAVALESDKNVVYCDFSQSYKNQEHNEIQSAYFGHKCLSLFTACCYVRELSSNKVVAMPITVTTEGSEHSRQTSMSCLDVLKRL